MTSPPMTTVAPPPVAAVYAPPPTPPPVAAAYAAPVPPTPPAAVVSSSVPAGPCHSRCPTALGAQSNVTKQWTTAQRSTRTLSKSCFDKMLYREKQPVASLRSFTIATPLQHCFTSAGCVAAVISLQVGVRHTTEAARSLTGLPMPLPIEAVSKMVGRDHDPRRAVAISATSSLLANDSEARPRQCSCTATAAVI